MPWEIILKNKEAKLLNFLRCNYKSHLGSGLLKSNGGIPLWQYLYYWKRLVFFYNFAFSPYSTKFRTTEFISDRSNVWETYSRFIIIIYLFYIDFLTNHWSHSELSLSKFNLWYWNYPSCTSQNTRIAIRHQNHVKCRSAWGHSFFPKPLTCHECSWKEDMLFCMVSTTNDKMIFLYS